MTHHQSVSEAENCSRFSPTLTKSTTASCNSNLYSVNYTAERSSVNDDIVWFFVWERPSCLSCRQSAYLADVWGRAASLGRPLPTSLSAAVFSQTLDPTARSRLTDYLWSGAQTDSVQATINTAAIIPASSNLPSPEPDDVKKITAQRSGPREMEAVQSAPVFFFNRLRLIKKKNEKEGGGGITRLWCGCFFLLNTERRWKLTWWKKKGTEGRRRKKKRPNVLIKIVQIWWWSREKPIEAMCLLMFSPSSPRVFTFFLPSARTISASGVFQRICHKLGMINGLTWEQINVAVVLAGYEEE